jgi:large repetitive protein
MRRPDRPRGRFALRTLTLVVAALTAGLPTGAPAVHAAPLPTISVSDVTTTEGNGGTHSVTFLITQSGRAKSSIHWATANGTASNPADYLSRSGTVRFAGGHKKNKVTVTIVGDVLDEANETFFVRLSAPVGATIADGEGQGTITDDDAPPTVSTVGTVSVPEGSGGAASTASIDITLSAVSGRNVSVDYATADGSATAGSDYDAVAGTLDIPAGQTVGTVLVAITGDDTTELGDETFDLDISNPTNATLGTHPAVVTIVDNDPIPPGSAIFTIAGGSIKEGNVGTTTLDFVVTRSGVLTTAVNVDFETTNGTALAPSDYTTNTGNVAFAPSETSKTISVAIVGDRRLENREKLFVSLLNPSAGSAIEDGQGKGFIDNDDTRTTLTVTKRHGRIRASGRVSTAQNGKHMVVRLYRRKNGAWVRIAVRRPLLSGTTDLNGDGFTDSRYGARFKRPKPGRCRIVARFPGTASHGSSRAAKNFRC